MLLAVERDGATCLETRRHLPQGKGRNIICIRCGMLLGRVRTPKLGSLLDY